MHKDQPSLTQSAIPDEGNFVTLPDLHGLDETLPDLSGWRAAKQVAYYHIPHSGGVSLREALEKVWGEDRAYLDTRDAVRAFLDLPAEQRQQPYFVNYHVSGRIRRHLHPSARVMAMIRDPVQHILAGYYWHHMHRGRGIPWVEPLIEEGVSLRRYVEIHSAAGGFSGSLIQWLHSLATDPLASPASPYTLTELIEIIESEIDFICITEYFDESLFVLSLLNGLHHIPTWSRAGASGAAKREDLDPAIIRAIERLLEPDITLYERYRSLFLERYAEPIAWCRRHIGSLEKGKALKQAAVAT